jgi:hypothetical protein
VQETTGCDVHGCDDAARSCAHGVAGGRRKQGTADVIDLIVSAGVIYSAD